MAYNALAVLRTPDGWSGHDVELAEVADLDAAADLLRDAATDADAPDGPALLLIEENDEYVGIIRVDGDDDPQVFISDRRAVDGSDLAERLFADAVPAAAAPASEDDDDEDNGKPVAEPGGEAGLLADLGTPGEDLLALCAQEGQLPADVIAAVCERAGAGHVVEELRGV